MRTILAAVIALTALGGATAPPARAQMPSDPYWLTPTRHFVECMDTEERKGGYSSTDGGQSEMRLMVACQPQWDAYITGCVASGRDRSRCVFMSSLAASATLNDLSN